MTPRDNEIHTLTREGSSEGFAESTISFIVGSISAGVIDSSERTSRSCRFRNGANLWKSLCEGFELPFVEEPSPLTGVVALESIEI